jgi:nitrogen-specific signal transduction histidine kinase
MINLRLRRKIVCHHIDKVDILSDRIEMLSSEVSRHFIAENKHTISDYIYPNLW